MHGGLKTAFTVQLRFPQHREIPSWQQADSAGFVPPLLHPPCRGWEGRAACSQRASTGAKALWTMRAAMGGPVSCLPSWLHWPFSFHPHMHAGLPEEHMEPAWMPSRRRETKASRKELSPGLPLTQGWHSSFASWVPRRPRVSWRYTLLRLMPNSYRPKEKKAGQKRKILPEHGGKKGFQFYFMPLWGQTADFVVVEWNNTKRKCRDLTHSEWSWMRPMVRAMVTAAGSKTAQMKTLLIAKVIESAGRYTSTTMHTLQIHFLKKYLLCLKFSVKYMSSL